MAKLGKKARKFAKKNLQSVLKKQRKLKSMFKKRSSKKDGREDVEESEDETAVLETVRNNRQNLSEFALDAMFSEDSDAVEDDSDSDGYLSEDSALLAAYSVNDSILGDSCESALSKQNREMYLELVKKEKKLVNLKEKDPKFSKLLESYNKKRISRGKIEDSDEDEDEMSVDEVESGDEDSNGRVKNVLTCSAVDSLCQQVKEHQNLSALTTLLNGYRTACHFEAGSSGSHRFQNSEAFSKILTLMLNEADNIFRKLLGLSSPGVKKEKISELKSTSKWIKIKPLIKSYLKSTLFLMNQVTETEILSFTIARARASIALYVVFPSLLKRLVKTAIQFWATGGGSVSSDAFNIVQDLSSLYSSDWFDTCLAKMFKSFIGQCHFVEHDQLRHVQYLRDSFVELCSVDVQKSSRKAMISIEHLAKMLHHALQTKTEQAVRNICSWQYISCIDLWVSFISANIHDYELQALASTIIQVILGVTLLLHGPRYLPLRVKCIQWLNDISSSSGIFIPVTSIILEVLDYKTGENAKHGEAFNLSGSLKLPKHLLKSRNFQELCILSAIELLSAHFAQWSYNISFPELATIPLVYLRKFHESTTVESFKRMVKRFITQVEDNLGFVQRKRDEVAYSPKDQQSVVSFLQLEKHNGQMPFTQYYKSIIDKAVARNRGLSEKARNDRRN